MAAAAPYGAASELDPDELDAEEINQDDAWAVITSYFEEKGLVRQQLDSYNEFAENTMQEIVEECAHVEIVPVSQHRPDQAAGEAEVAGKKYYVDFGQVWRTGRTPPTPRRGGCAPAGPRALLLSHSCALRSMCAPPRASFIPPLPSRRSTSPSRW